MKSPLLSILFCTVAGWAIATAQVKTPIVIPFTKTGQGHILVKAHVNGVEGTFIFDTGAGLNLLTKKFADKVASLQKTDGFFVGHRATGEAIETDIWIIKDLQLGNFQAANQKTAVLDMEFPIDGLISLMPFKHGALTIDYAQSHLIVESPAALQTMAVASYSLPLQVVDDRDISLEIATYVQLNNKVTAQISLDCGAGWNVFRFSARYMKQLGIDTTQTTNVYARSPFDTTKGNHYYSTTLQELRTTTPGAGVKNIKTTFIDGLIWEGITSINWLGDRITIDIPRKRLLLPRK
ncbi:retropepsin-like aspartic protease [Paraflavitalea pollutisoli]|uniref:retropepsin-like aspartic protease n=1 Tax=Paraflavitalea pollutisoli TaxID=3034143 RepID=UPI0023EDECB4|nr:retropepsin-like aspartic protease [Paraflavitalea sp. H1-2-19X]